MTNFNIATASDLKITLNGRIYPDKIIQRAIIANHGLASFNLEKLDNDLIIVHIFKKKESFQEVDFLDDLNHYLFLDQQDKEAAPIRQIIMEGLLKKLINE